MSELNTTAGAVARNKPERSLELALAAAKTIAENRGRQIVVLDMTKHTALFDYFVIGTGTSGRQLRAVADEIKHVLEKEMGDKRLHIAGVEDSRWIVQDYGTIVVHLFDEETRAFYSLENLWADAVKLDISNIVPADSIG